jgi:hypothetical protein
MKQYEKPDTTIIDISMEYAFCQVSGSEVTSGGHSDTYDVEGDIWD